MQVGFYFDQRRCTGCQTCAVACKQWNGVPQGPVSWRRVRTVEEGRFPHVRVAHLSISCCHCSAPLCLDACPSGAISKRGEDGVVVVDQALCITGCRSCLHACPYEAPQWREGDSKMEMCDLCQERLAEGKKPLCVASCPLRALDAGPMEDLENGYGGGRTAVGFPDPARTMPSIIFRSKQ